MAFSLMAVLTSKNQENFNNVLQEKLAVIAKLETNVRYMSSEISLNHPFLLVSLIIFCF